MKYTLITLAALSGAAFAQSFNDTSLVRFDSAADFIAGTGTVVNTGHQGWDVYDRESGGWISKTSGAYYLGGQQAVASWLTNVGDFVINSDGSYSAYLASDALGASAGDHLVFGSIEDFVNGTGFTNAGGSHSLGYDRFANATTGGWYHRPTGDVNIGGLTGNAAWVKDTLTDVVMHDDGTILAYIRKPSVVPEPSSAALLGLGGLALILRRRK